MTTVDYKAQIAKEDINWGIGTFQRRMSTGEFQTLNLVNLYPESPWVDVRAFSTVAIGDGVTDDVAVIQAAIDSLPASGGTVYLGAAGANYLIKSTININKKVLLIGHGKNENYGIPTPTLITKDSTLNGPAIYVTAARAILQGFTLNGATGNGGDGIVIDNNGVKIQDVSVYNMGNDGVRVGADIASGNQNSWYMQNVTSDNNTRHGFYFHSVNNSANAGNGVHLEARLNGGDGIVFGTAIANTLLGPLAEANTGSGVHFLNGASKNIIVGGDLDESNVTRDLTMDSGSLYNVILYASVAPNYTLDNGTGNFIHYANVSAPAQMHDVTVRSLSTRRAANMEIVNGNNNDVVLPGGGSFVRVTGQTDTTAVITGIVAPYYPGYRLVLANGGGYTFTLSHQDSNSSAANRITCPTGSNLSVSGGGAIELIYDDGSTSWIAIKPG